MANILKKERISSIEVMRSLAIFCVICIHTSPFHRFLDVHFMYRWAHILILTFCHFGVPFFFITAGFFFNQSVLQKNESILNLFGRYSKRLLIIFVIWSIIYAFMPEDFLWSTLKLGFKKGLILPSVEQLLLNISRFKSDPVFFMFESTKSLLWFLPALILGLGVLTFFVVHQQEKFLFPFSIVLYLIGLSLSSYQSTPLGLHLPFRFDGKTGPFISTLFLTIGWWFAQYKLKLSVKGSIALAVFGFVFCLIENATIRKFYNSNMVTMAFGFGTILFATGMFAYALADPHLGRGTFFPKIAEFTLGIYVSHILVWELTWNFTRFFHPVVWEVVFPFIIYFTALCLVFIVKKIPFLEKAVT